MVGAFSQVQREHSEPSLLQLLGGAIIFLIFIIVLGAIQYESHSEERDREYREYQLQQQKNKNSLLNKKIESIDVGHRDIVIETEGGGSFIIHANKYSLDTHSNKSE